MTENFEPCAKQTQEQGLYEGIGAIFTNYNAATSKMDEGQFVLFD
jgi:hypothetical protein